jgi:hypothetical protein
VLVETETQRALSVTALGKTFGSWDSAESAGVHSGEAIATACKSLDKRFNVLHTIHNGRNQMDIRPVFCCSAKLERWHNVCRHSQHG